MSGAALRRSFWGVVRSDVRDNGLSTLLRAANTALGISVAEDQLIVRGEGHVILYPSLKNDRVSMSNSPPSSLGIDYCGFPILTDESLACNKSVYGPHSTVQTSARASISEDTKVKFTDIDGPCLMARVDTRSADCILGRDKFGQRQLYYYSDNEHLWFADNIRVLVALKSPTRVRPGALLEWMHFGIPIPPYTMFSDIWVLPGGWQLRYNWRNQSLETKEIFNPTHYINAEMARELALRSPDDLQNNLFRIVEDTVVRAVEGKRAVTVLLSGGTDSSGIAAILAKSAEVHAVNINVYGKGTESEVGYAKEVANHLNIDLAVCDFGREQYRNSLCDAVYDLGVPPIIGNAIALYYAARSGAVSRGQLVVDGEGADAHYFGTVPLFQYSLVTQVLSGFLRISSDNARKLLNRIRRITSKLGLINTTSIDPQGLNVLLGARGLLPQNRLYDLFDSLSHIENLPEREIAALCLREFQDYLMPLVLRLDTMAAVAETNVVLPFVLKDIFEFSVNLPVGVKVRPEINRKGYEVKRIWKNVVSKLVPPHVVYRAKGGFDIPTGIWSAPLPNQWLASSWVGEYFKLPDSELRKWWDRGPPGNDGMYMAGLEIWGRLFERGESFEKVRGEWLEE